jgi:hypothetical protein
MLSRRRARVSTTAARAATLRTIATAVAIIVGISNCRSSATDPESTLAAARARWADRAPPAYSVTILRTCECLRDVSGPVRVVVRNGVVESRQYLESGAAVAPQYAELFPAVEGLFSLIDSGIRDDSRPLSAQYDATLGYPIRFAIGDPAADAPLYIVSEFRRR